MGREIRCAMALEPQFSHNGTGLFLLKACRHFSHPSLLLPVFATGSVVTGGIARLADVSRIQNDLRCDNGDGRARQIQAGVYAGRVEFQREEGCAGSELRPSGDAGPSQWAAFPDAGAR